MSRIYKAAPHTGSTPKAASSSTMAVAAASAAAAPAPAPVVDSSSQAKAVSVGDGALACAGCNKRLFGSGQRLGGKPYCTSCFKSGGGRRADWTPSVGAPPVFGAFGANKFGANAGGSGAAAASPTAKPAAASPKPTAASPKPVAEAAPSGGGSGVTECHFCDLPIAGKRAPSHDVGGEPYCDVCYREMSDSLADANEKAAEVAYKLGGSNGPAQSLADKPAAKQPAGAAYPANASNFSDGDLKSMFMANYRKNKAGGAAAPAAAALAAVASAPVCSQCGTAGDDGARFCGQCGGPMTS